MATARSREFTYKEKQEIIAYYESSVSSGHKITQKTLTEWANAKYYTSVSAMSIGRLLKKKDSVSKEDVAHLGDMKRLRKVHNPVLELVTFKWVTAMLERGASLSDDLI